MIVEDHPFAWKDGDRYGMGGCASCAQPCGAHRFVPGRRVAEITGLERPGDYYGPVDGYTSVPAVFFLKPNSRDSDAPPPARSVQHVCSPPHTFREASDGSLEVRQSISNLLRGDTTGDTDDGWHGWLDEGHQWRLA